MGFLDKLKNVVRWATVTGPVDQTQQFPVQQLTYKGKVANCMMVFPYGMYSHVSTTDALVMMFAVEGNADNRAGIPAIPQKRPVDLEQNEVAIYHPFTNSFIKFRNNGNIEIDTAPVNAETGEQTLGSITVNCVNATVTASENVNVTAIQNIGLTCVEATVTASTSVTIDTPETTITGNLTVQGDTTLTSTVTSGGKDISDTHTHVGSPSAPTGGVSNTGAPV